MCAIIGIFGLENARNLAAKGLEVMKARGMDNTGIEADENNALGHNLHAIVGNVKQPLKGKGILVSNCEIYNWKELSRKHGLNAENDSDLVFKMFENDMLPEMIEELDGDYAVAYWREGKVIIARDNIGVKPVWFSTKNGDVKGKDNKACFGFASEKKALESAGFEGIEELNPRKMIVYDIKKRNITERKRKFFSIKPEHKQTKEEIRIRVTELLQEAVRKRVPQKSVGLLFSGGIDSTMIAVMLKRLGVDFTCYTAALDSETEAEDVVYARKVAEALGLKLKIIKIKLEEVEGYLRKIVPLIEDSNVVKVGVALPFYVCCETAKRDGIKVILSGLGSEEIFAGYERHKRSININRECYSGLLKMYERDLYRDDVVTMSNSIELRVPFLDKELVSYALKIPSVYKLSGERNKIALRDAAAKLGLDNEFAERKKRAAQYGSRFDKAIEKLAKKSGSRTKSEYLKGFYIQGNIRLGVLFSSGKDSAYAAYVMKRQNYDIACLITIKSRNTSSYMFHTPAVDLSSMQAEAMGIPLVVQVTEGVKEKELKDLEKAIKQAKKEYHIEGIVTGALFSDYQRKRIEKICEKLGLKVFSPLWHKNQEEYMRELLDNGFRFIMTAVAAEGLDKSWLGREITQEDIKKLSEIHKRLGINVAGEGGEFESLVIDSPMFRKRIEIKEFEIKEESENTAVLDIKKAVLEEKN
ncbi:MAG: diphthine--ammonia ligase [Nanoarchaeota archaeon]|nr:diphthine--ammonia ligase [Nanoarchaeota archaeon]